MTRPECSGISFLPILGLAFAAQVMAAPDATVALGDLEWADGSNGADVRWAEADAFCQDLELAGQADWRLPSLAELEALHDPDQPGGMRAEISLDDCCLWSTTTLEDRSAPDADGVGADISRYHWGFLYDGGIRYYSIDLQPDGRALCVRDRG